MAVAVGSVQLAWFGQPAASGLDASAFAEGTVSLIDRLPGSTALAKVCRSDQFGESVECGGGRCTRQHVSIDLERLLRARRNRASDQRR